MKFYSTRDTKQNKSLLGLRQAILQGQSPDGGLFVPDTFPTITIENKSSYIEVAEQVLTPFLKEELSSSEISALVNSVFNFPVPIAQLKDFGVLELFHGPTAAFKDFGARFLARLMQAFSLQGTILVATSGDTGGAVAAAFSKVPGIKVVVLYPKNGVSPLQEKQLTCWGENIVSLRVRGDFDDCQRLVKECFSDSHLNKKYSLTSANSINIGRLLPQMVYYFWGVIKEHKNYFIPTGNMGNAMAALWARQCGAQIDSITLCTNANPSLQEYFTSGKTSSKKSIRTLANAMDVAIPSNLERYHLLKDNFLNMAKKLEVEKISDEEIIAAIKNCYQKFSYLLCPHTATAYASWHKNKEKNHKAILVSTAHPAKFLEVVEPHIGRKIEMPQTLTALLQLPSQWHEIEAKKDSVTTFL